MKGKNLRLDKFLKVSRLIKRRSVANKFCTAKKIYLNDKIAKAAAKVKVNDIVKIELKVPIKVRVLKISEISTKDTASQMYEIIWK